MKPRAPFKARTALGNAIVQIRIRRGLRREEFAEEFNCPSNTLLSWELGRFFPSAGRLIALRFLAETPAEVGPIEKALEKLGISPAWLALKKDTGQSISGPTSMQSAG